MDKYMLISVRGREILTEKFKTLELAQQTMHKEMIEQGKVPEEVFENDTYEDCECGFGKYSAWANDGLNHADFDWLIVAL